MRYLPLALLCFFWSPLASLLSKNACTSVRAQIEDWGSYYGITCTTLDTAETFVPAASAILDGSAGPGAVFILDFTADVPAEARDAIRFAADVWGAYLVSDVPIRVRIDWQDRMDDRLLASAGPGTLFRGFAGSRPDVWYPVALAEAIAGQPLNDDGAADINVTANSTANWYFPTDGNTPRNRIDLASVMLHELGHGLGFLSSVDTIGPNELQLGFGGRFIIYDEFLQTPAGMELTDAGLFANPSPELLVAVSEDNLFFGGDNAVNANDDDIVPLFAPQVFNSGSSVSHLGEGDFRPGSENALMTPFLSAGEAVHDPGPITLGIFRDLGWTVNENLTSIRPRDLVEIGLFPNPATEFVTLQLGPRATPGYVTLHAADGRTVRRQPVPAGESAVRLEIAGLPAGFYTVRTGVGVGKMVVR